MKFSEKFIKEYLSSHQDDKSIGINATALKLMAELVELMVTEGANRTVQQAKEENSDTVTLQHLEKILPQFMLDLS